MAIKRGGRTLTPREQAAEVRRLAGWDVKTYQREYDKLRNRVRAYERATGSERKINVSDLLARDVRRRAMARYYGEPYRPTTQMRAILAAPSISSGGRLSAAAAARIQNVEMQRLEQQYYGLIHNSKYSDIIARRRAAMEAAGVFDAQSYGAMLEQYARMLDNERENIKKLNDAAPGGEVVEFYST